MFIGNVIVERLMVNKCSDPAPTRIQDGLLAVFTNSNHRNPCIIFTFEVTFDYLTVHSWFRNMD